MDEVQLSILNEAGSQCALLRVHPLPGIKDSPVPAIQWLTPSQAQLREATEYVYEVVAYASEQITCDQPAIFIPDDTTGMRGRLRTGFYTGSLKVSWMAQGEPLGSCSFEIHSIKIDYLSHYQWMLRDIAEFLTEIIMERFAPTSHSFSPDTTRDALTLYQRFAFLKALLEDQNFRQATEQLLHSPKRDWVGAAEPRDPALGLPCNSQVAKQIARPGKRRNVSLLSVPSLPTVFPLNRSFETLDNDENRFVKHALITWRKTVEEILQALGTEATTATIERGQNEAREVLNQLDEILSHEMFKGVGELRKLPFSSQVLQKRAGYRDYFRSYVLFEAAARIQWSGAEDVFAAVSETWQLYMNIGSTLVWRELYLSYAALAGPRATLSL